MSSTMSRMSDHLVWKQAYLTAILEKDRDQIVARVKDAKVKLASREQELKLVGGLPCEEAEAIQEAAYMLDALQTSLAYRE